MCGIAVIIDLAPNDELKPSAHDTISKMLERLHARGPDDSTITEIPSTKKLTSLSPKVTLGHTRLNIVGGKAAKHPFMWSKHQKRMALIHNGEVYNYQELKKTLIDQGYCQAKDFKSECDSEVLLACCSLRGVQWTLNKINGMFSFVLVEFENQANNIEVVRRVILSRDVFGIKPLCYSRDKHRIIIASEVSAIPRDCGLDQDNMQIEDILPATYMELTFQENNYGTASKSFSLVMHTNDFGPSWRSIENIANESKKNEVVKCNISISGQKKKESNSDCNTISNVSLKCARNKLIDAVHLRLPNDRVAVLLSGGLDSSLIASIAAARFLGERNLRTFNIRFQDESNDYNYAKKVVQHLTNIEHEEFKFSLNDGIAILPEVIRCLETDDVVCIRAGVPLYLLSKYIGSRGFKIVLCGEGADESMAGYRLFERFSLEEEEDFQNELKRRLINIDTSELQRVDRCTSAHGLEARVPFLDLNFVQRIMEFNPSEKMTHSSLGRIQKYIIRRAFDPESTSISRNDRSLWFQLPDSILYREKEQFADGIGRGWIRALQDYAVKKMGIANAEDAEKAMYKHIFLEDKKCQYLKQDARESLLQTRQVRRKKNQTSYKYMVHSASLASASTDLDLQALNVSKEDAHNFLQSVLGWNSQELDFHPTLSSLNLLIESMLQKVPFHNLTLLVRERRPPSLIEIKQDMMSGLGGPCSVVNCFFAAILIALGFGPNVYLLSCHILDQENCHLAILVQIKGLRYFVDVANAKPYFEAIHLGDSSIKTSMNGSFEWHLSFNTKSRLIDLMHFDKVALSFDPSSTKRFSSFRKMIEQSRTDKSFGPFLTGLRFCLYPNSNEMSSIMAVRDAFIYEGESTKKKKRASNRSDIVNFSKSCAFSHIEGFCSLVENAIHVLDKENKQWFDNSGGK